MTYETSTVETFLSEVASQKVAPAGGATAAVAGAMGASLCEMVCPHAIGNDGYDDVESELAAIRPILTRSRKHLLRLADSDATLLTRSLESAHKSRQRTVKRMIGIPFTIAKACVTVLESACVVTAKGAESALADAVTGVLLTRAAFTGAVYIVRVNDGYVQNTLYSEKIEQRLSQLESDAADAFDRNASNIEARDHPHVGW